MVDLDIHLVRHALAATGEELARRGRVAELVVPVIGGSAGLLGGLLAPDRVTADCDVVWNGTPEDWKELQGAADAVQQALGLAPDWLNLNCTDFAWSFPLGWRSRCEEAGKFGPLRVIRFSRFDLIASKVFSGPLRGKDRGDLAWLRPTLVELQGVEEHLDRLELEDLDRQTFDRQRTLIHGLRGGA